MRPALRGLDLRTFEVVLESGKVRAIERGIAEYTPVSRNQRDAALDELRQPVRLVVQHRVGEAVRIAREELGDEERLIGEPALDEGALFTPKLPRDDHRCDGQRRRRHGHRRDEQLRAEAEGHVTSPSASL